MHFKATVLTEKQGNFLENAINFSFENRTNFFFGGKMMLKTSDRLKPLNPKVFETNKKYTQRMHQI